MLISFKKSLDTLNFFHQKYSKWCKEFHNHKNMWTQILSHTFLKSMLNREILAYSFFFELLFCNQISIDFL